MKRFLRFMVLALMVIAPVADAQQRIQGTPNGYQVKVTAFDANGNPIIATLQPCYIKSGTGTTNDMTNHANCKASAGTFFGARAINTTGTIAYLRMYNLASDPTCSSATGFVESLPIPANTTGAGFIDIFSAFAYTTGISYCVTANGANNDNNAPVAGVYITIGYN